MRFREGRDCALATKTTKASTKIDTILMGIILWCEKWRDRLLQCEHLEANGRWNTGGIRHKRKLPVFWIHPEGDDIV